MHPQIKSEAGKQRQSTVNTAAKSELGKIRQSF